MSNPYAPPRTSAELDVPSPADEAAKPRWFDLFLLLMVGFHLAYFATALLDEDGSVLHELKYTIPALLIYWAFSKGHNWARWLVILGSAVGMLSFTFLSEFNWAERIVLFLEAPFNLYLLYWLNTEPVKLYCGAQAWRGRAG